MKRVLIVLFALFALFVSVAVACPKGQHPVCSYDPAKGRSVCHCVSGEVAACSARHDAVFSPERMDAVLMSTDYQCTTTSNTTTYSDGRSQTCTTTCCGDPDIAMSCSTTCN